MTKPFLITGLPRSRTAWLSIAANNEKSICYHEPLVSFSKWQDVYALWRSQDYEFTGVSDSGLGFHLIEILETAQPRTLVVSRPINTVTKSLDKIGVNGAQQFCMLLADRLAAASAHPLVKRVNYEELRDPAIVAACLRWLMPGLGVDMNKLGELHKMNVQTDAGTARIAATKRKADAPALLGPAIFDKLNGSSIQV